MGFRTYVLALTTAALGYSDRTARVLAAVADARSADTEENEPYYRREGSRKRDVNAAERDRAIEDGVKSWQRDGFAARVVSVVKFYAVGATPVTATATAEDDADRELVQRHIDRVWNDRRNKLARGVLEFYDAASATGELCLLLGFGAESRMTRVGYVDPADIECVLTDPDDARRTIGVVRRASSFVAERRLHPVPDENGEYFELFRLSPAQADRPIAEGTKIEVPTGIGHTLVSCVVAQPALYLGLNKLPNQARGSSDLFRIFHVLEMIDRNVWGFGERMRGLQAFCWDIETTAKGKEREELLEHATEATTKAGGVFMHPPGTKLLAVTPQLGTLDWKEAFGILAGVLTTATGIPPHFFTGEGGDLSLANAGELAGPFLAMVGERQGVVRDYFNTLLTLALRQVPEIEAMYRDDPGRVGFDLSFPVVTAKDAMRAISVLAAQVQVVNALRTNLGLSFDAAVREVIAAAAEYGFQFTPEDFDELSAGMFRGVPFPGSGGGNEPDPAAADGAAPPAPDGQMPGDRRAAPDTSSD